MCQIAEAEFGGGEARDAQRVAVGRGWQVGEVVDVLTPMDAASLVTLGIGHLALELIEDLDEPFYGPFTVRHVLSHTSGLPNDRPPGGGTGLAAAPRADIRAGRVRNVPLDAPPGLRDIQAESPEVSGTVQNAHAITRLCVGS
jgi:hypothetical protein